MATQEGVKGRAELIHLYPPLLNADNFCAGRDKYQQIPPLDNTLLPSQVHLISIHTNSSAWREGGGEAASVGVGVPYSIQVVKGPPSRLE